MMPNDSEDYKGEDNSKGDKEPADKCHSPFVLQIPFICPDPNQAGHGDVNI
jgi:hypothetical protein